MGSILVVIYFSFPPSGYGANDSEQSGVPKFISDSVDVDFYTAENKNGNKNVAFLTAFQIIFTTSDKRPVTHCAG